MIVNADSIVKHVIQNKDRIKRAYVNKYKNFYKCEKD